MSTIPAAPAAPATSIAPSAPSSTGAATAGTTADGTDVATAFAALVDAITEELVAAEGQPTAEAQAPVGGEVDGETTGAGEALASTVLVSLLSATPTATTTPTAPTAPLGTQPAAGVEGVPAADVDVDAVVDADLPAAATPGETDVDATELVTDETVATEIDLDPTADTDDVEIEIPAGSDADIEVSTEGDADIDLTGQDAGDAAGEPTDIESGTASAARPATEIADETVASTVRPAATTPAGPETVAVQPTVTAIPDATATTPDAIATAAATAPAAPTSVDAPTAATSAARTPAPVLSEQLVSVLAPMRKAPDGTHSISMQLRPDELGEVQIDVRVRGNEITLHLRADLAGTTDLLRASIAELRAELEAAGFQAGDLDVANHGADTSADERSTDTAEEISGPSLSGQTTTNETGTDTRPTSSLNGLDLRL